METNISSIRFNQEEIIEEFAHFEEWTDKYEYLIDIGKTLPPLDPKYKTEFHLVKGCQSKVWLHADVKDGRLYLDADSDTVITKGIVALLIRVMHGQKIEVIEHANLYFIEAIGLRAHLSPTRSNGLTSMIQHIRSYTKHLPAASTTPKPADMPEDQYQAMVEKIKTIYDPEIPVDIWELGLIYSLDINELGKATVTMTLTSPACPVAESLPMEVQEKLLSLPFVNDVELSLVWNPAWNKARMSDEARMALDMF